MKKYIKYIILLLCIISFFVSICFIPISASRLIPIIEEQVAEELGINIHIEKLILRTGPVLKLKVPIMHFMYNDGQKFAQLDNVKFYISWSSILKEKTVIKSLKAKKLTVRLLSDDTNLMALLESLNNKDFKEIPNIKLKEYHISYLNKDNNDKYFLEGQNLELNKISNIKSFKVKSSGAFSINSTKHITYDLNLNPKLDIDVCSFNLNLLKVINKIKELDFYSDIIADVKLYKTQDKVLQASGFINIDNVSVLDSAKKNPKSFVYLTLWGDKASVLSNIYTSINKKVYIEGMVNNSKKPFIDLKVKTDRIDIKDLYNKLRFITDFSHFEEIQYIDGTLDANFTLKGDLNKIKSNGFLKINDAKLLANGIKIDKINSEIDFSNNIINILNTTGYVNNSPIIIKGKIDKYINIDVLMNKVLIKHLFPSKYGIKDGVVSLIGKITGTLENPVHKENLLIENFKLQNNDLDLSFETLKFDTNKSNMAYVNNVNCKTQETETIKIPTLKLLIESENIKLPETNVFMPNSKLVIKGELQDYNSNNLNYVLTLDGFLNSKDFIRLSKHSTRYPIKIVTNGTRLAQNINLQLFLEKTDIFDEPTVLNLSSKYEKKVLKIEDLSLNSISGNFLNDFKLNLKGTKKLIVTGIIENAKEPVFKNLRIFIPQLLNINIYDTLAQIKGDLFLNGAFNKPEIIGQLNIQNMFNQPLQLALTNGTVDFNKTNIVVNAPQIKLNDSSFAINALVATDVAKQITIKNIIIKSKYLNTDTFLMYKDSPIFKLYPYQVLDGKLYSERVLTNLYGSQAHLTAFVSDFNIKNNVIYLKNMALELFNGKLMGKINYNLRDEHFTSAIMARGVSAEPIFNIISTRKESISGVMDFDANLSGELTAKNSLNGNIKFIVNNGRMGSLGKLEHLLYAQNVVADHMLRTSLSVVTKAITLKDTGLFKYLRGDVNLDKGIARINMLQSQGPLMSLFIKGDYNTMNDYAKLVVLGRLSDEIITGLGAFGDFSLNKLMIMLTGEENQYQVLTEDFEKIPQLPVKNTKEFRSIINGIIDKPSSVAQFNWISYSEKKLKQKEVPMTETKLPDFIENLPY